MILLDDLPLWAVYLGSVAALLIMAEIGFRIGIWLQRRQTGTRGSPISDTVLGGMLALLAFLIAFAIGIVIDQHNGRRAMVVTEANAIGTAYLRAGFLAEPARTDSRDLLLEYVEIRLAAAADPAQFAYAQTRSEQIHGELWSIVQDYVRQGNESDIVALIVESVNEVITVHTERLAAANLRLPRLVGILLYVAMLIGFMLVGIANSGDGERDFAAMVLFAMAFVAVFMIIVDLDRPQQGLINVSQSALEDLLRRMAAAGS